MKTYYDQVKSILTFYPETRDDDMKLYAKFLEMGDLVSKYETFYDVLNNAKQRKLPSYEGITRSRRRIQELEPALRGTKYAHRKQKEDEYHEHYSNPTAR